MPKTPQAVSQVELDLIERRLGEGRGIELRPTTAGREIAQTAFAQELAVIDQLPQRLGAQNTSS